MNGPKVAAKLRMHDDVVHKNLEGKYKCAYCPKRFWGKSSLREHTNGVHLNTKPHKCSLCDFASSYRSKFILSNVLSQFDGFQKRFPFPSDSFQDVVDRRYLTSFSVNLQWRPFKCSLCDFNSSYRSKFIVQTYFRSNLTGFRNCFRFPS